MKLGEREVVLYNFFKELLRDLNDFEGVETRVVSPSLTTGELFLRSDRSYLVELCKKLQGKTLCNVLYAAGLLPAGERSAYEEKTIKDLERLKREIQEFDENIVYRDARTDLNKGSSLTYCVMELEVFLDKHPGLDVELVFAIRWVINTLDLTDDMRELVDSKKI